MKATQATTTPRATPGGGQGQGGGQPTVAVPAPPAPPTEGSTTQGMPPQLGHLGIVVGLVWRSVVLWMLLVALLKLANLLP